MEKTAASKRYVMDHLYEMSCWMKRLYRRGKRFQQYSKLLSETAMLPPQALARMQDLRLRRMIHHCYENVPYYRDLFDRLHLKPEDIQTRNDLQKLPLMTKEDVHDHYDKLIAPNRKSRLSRTCHTSGTTGTPAKFLRDYNSINFENAAVWRQWQQAGYTGQKRLTLRGEVVVPSSQSSPPFWRYNPAENELVMSGYHMSIANSRLYIDKILEYEPDYLSSFPSLAYLLAKYFRAHNMTYPFKGAFTSSEMLEPDVRKYLEDTFQCWIHDWYGQVERVSAIAQCPVGSYHIQEDYSFTELLPAENGTHEIVGTHLFNFAQPLLRYRTLDYVKQSEERCTCGSAFRIVENLLGRTYSYLLTPEGYQISVISHIPRGVDNLIETQFYQERPDEIVVNVLTNGRFSERDREQLMRNTREHTSPQIKITVREVDEIPRGPNGKFLGIINKIEMN